MRINKYIASAGICSRRKADELIKSGKVSVNGEVIKKLGTDIGEEDTVHVEGTQISAAQEKKIYIALNKPKGYITTSSDEKGRPTVMELVSDIPARLFPVGRLDENTTGLIILTNDGDFSHSLMHPKHGLSKKYIAKVSGHISEKKISLLRKGVDIETEYGTYKTKPAKVDLKKISGNNSIVEITIYEGKNRQIRKMFSAVGNKVLELERIAIGEILLRNLKEGHYRKLTKAEIKAFIS